MGSRRPDGRALYAFDAAWMLERGGTLAGADEAGQADDRARADVEVDVVEDAGAGQAAHLEHRLADLGG